MGTYDTHGGAPRHDPMFDHDGYVSPLQEAIIGLLEEAEISQQIIDQICSLIEKGEREKWAGTK